MEAKDKTKEELLAELDRLHKIIALSNLKIQKEIQKRMKDSQIHFDITMQRELKMVELKNEINELAARLGEKKRYGS